MPKANPQHAKTQNENDGLDKANKFADLLYKGLILIVGSVVAAAFFFQQDRQTQRHSAADLMAQRENADSQLRAQMFRTLFDAYFADMMHAASAGPSGDAPVKPDTEWIARLETLKRESMFSDLLSRNFDDIDVRPLLEDLDAQLSRFLVAENADAEPKRVVSDRVRQRAFALRESLRRAAIGASTRQATSLVGGVSAKLRVTRVKQCKDSVPEPQFLFEDWNLVAKNLSDGVVDMQVYSDDNTSATQLEVSFYDMPALENLVLPSGERVAFMLTHYESYDACTRFKDQLSEGLRSDCVALVAEKAQCDRALITALIFPKGYVGPRDRPYLNDVIETGFGSASK